MAYAQSDERMNVWSGQKYHACSRCGAVLKGHTTETSSRIQLHDENACIAYLAGELEELKRQYENHLYDD